MMARKPTFSQWLAQAQVGQAALTAEQRTVLLAAFRFRQLQGTDYYATRLLGHFLLHCGVGLKVARIARLLGISRPTASRQQGLAAKEAIQQAHHRLDGRPHGKLLPRYAGPIAQFLCSHPQATRYDVLNFVEATFGVRASRIALYKFLKKYGLESVPDADSAKATPVPGLPATVPAATLATASAPPFCSGTPSTLAPSC